MEPESIQDTARRIAAALTVSGVILQPSSVQVIVRELARLDLERREDDRRREGWQAGAVIEKARLKNG